MTTTLIAASEIGPPLADWFRPNWCQHLHDEQQRHGPLIGIRLRHRRYWHGLDDDIREAINLADGHDRHAHGKTLWSWLPWCGWVMVARRHHPVLLDVLERTAHRDALTVREFPDRITCEHPTCNRRWRYYRALSVP